MIRNALKYTLLLLALCAGLAAHAQINTEQVLRIGRNALYFEDYILSIQYFNQVIKAKPFLAEPYFYRAVAKINLEDYKGAEQDAAMAIERNPFIVDAYQVRGIARQNQRDFAGAIQDYNRGLELNPEERVFLLNAAVCHDELKQFDQAQQCYDRLLRLEPKSDRARLGLAHLYLSKADTTAALEQVNKSIALSRNNANAYLMRAEINMRHNNDYAAALADMDSAVVLEPAYAGNFINRAFMKYHLDDYDGAMADYDYAISLDPTRTEPLFNRAMLLAEVGDNDKAIEGFSQVLRLDPDHFMAIYNRAMLYMQTGQYRRAVADLDRVLEKYPQFEAGFMARGEAKRKSGNIKGGNADYDHALAIFRKKKTHTSDFNPIQIEADIARQRNETPDTLPPTEDEITRRFNSLLTVTPENPIKPEYANRQRGRIQNSNIEVQPEPAFTLSYYVTDNALNGNTYYMREITDVNNAHLLSATLALVRGDQRLDSLKIAERFASIEYYNSLLAVDKPRAVDFLARAVDYLLVRNPENAIADATRAIALSPDFTLAYFLRACARYTAHQINTSSINNPQPSADPKAEAMLHRQQQAHDIADALADLEQVVKKSPDNVYAHFNRGYLLASTGDHTGALSAYSRAVTLKPDMGEAYYNRGLVYLQLGNRALGIADLSKAGELGILPSYNVLKRMN